MKGMFKTLMTKRTNIIIRKFFVFKFIMFIIIRFKNSFPDISKIKFPCSIIFELSIFWHLSIKISELVFNNKLKKLLQSYMIYINRNTKNE